RRLDARDPLPDGLQGRHGSAPLLLGAGLLFFVVLVVVIGLFVLDVVLVLILVVGVLVLDRCGLGLGLRLGRFLLFVVGALDDEGGVEGLEGLVERGLHLVGEVLLLDDA